MGENSPGFKIGLKHWIGTILIAIVASLVIFGMLRGQNFLADFLSKIKTAEPAPETEENDLNENSSQIISALATPTPSSAPNPAALGSGASKSPVPPSPSPTVLPSPTPSPILTKNPTPIPTPASMSVSTKSPTPSSTPTLTPTPAVTPTLTPSPTPPPVQTLPIVVNEIAWMGTAANANHEWIELYNPNPFSVDISVWVLKAVDGTPNITISSDKMIASFGYFLLERTSDGTISDISADQVYTGALGNGGEALEFIDNNGQLQDKVGHLDEFGQVSVWYAGENNTSTNPATRISMERINSLKPGDDSSNWQTNDGIIRNGLDANKNPINGTPKAPNSQ